MNRKTLFAALSIVLAAGLGACEEDSGGREARNDSCIDYPEMCAENQVCAEDGTCVEKPKSCKDDASICKRDEKCGDDGKCVKKTCKDDASICKDGEKCGNDGKCVKKTCKDDASICGDDEKCGDDGNCVKKTCKDDASICGDDEICGDDGNCAKKSCKDDASICKEDEICGDDGNCAKKSCKDDASICKEDEVCGDDGNCAKKSCKDDVSICKEDEVCGEDGNCVKKSCKDDASVCKADEKCGEDGNCVKKTCKEDFSVCKDGEYCDREGNCVLNTRSCKDDASICGEDGECSDQNECLEKEKDTPLFCSDEKVIQFFIDHFDLLKKVGGFAASVDEECKSIDALQSLFEIDGGALCVETEHCVKGSVDSFYECASYFVLNVLVGNIKLPDTVDKGEFDIRVAVSMAQIKNGRTRCEACGDVYCDKNEQICSEFACVERTCKNDTTLCQEGEVCGEDGRCIGSCITQDLCSAKAECSKDNECILDGVPEFCSNEKMTQFYIDHFGLIKDALGNKASFEDQCKAEDELRELIRTEGSKLCGEMEHCVTGSVTSFLECLDSFIMGVILHKIEIPEPYSNSDLNITSTVGLRHIIVGDGFCWACGTADNYCDSRSQKCYQNSSCMEKCDHYPAMCGANSVCDTKKKECMNADSEGNPGVTPTFCDDPSISEFIKANFEPIHRIGLNMGNKPIICDALRDMQKIFMSKGRDICGNIATCSTGEDTSFFRCTGNLMKSHVASMWDLPAEYANDKFNIGIVTLFNRVATNGVSAECKGNE